MYQIRYLHGLIYFKMSVYSSRYWLICCWLWPEFFDSLQGEPLKVLVTGAAGQIAYSLLYSVARGDVFGKDQVGIVFSGEFNWWSKTFLF